MDNSTEIPTPQILQEIRDNNAPHPDDMTVAEAIVCERMSFSGNQFDTLDSVIRTMVKDMLNAWGFDTRDIGIHITACVEQNVWRGQEETIDFSRIVPHILGMNAKASAYTAPVLHVTHGDRYLQKWSATDLEILRYPLGS